MSHPFDAAGKDLLETDPVAVAGLLGIVRPPGGIALVDAELSTVTAAADKVLRIADERPWMLHVEIQSSGDRSILRRMLQYNALLHARHGLPVDSVVILLVPAADAEEITGRYRSSGPYGPPWEFRYRVVRVWKLEAEALLQGPRSLLPRAPIARVSRRKVRGVLRDVVERLKTDATADEANRLFTALGVFLQLRYDAMTAEELIEKMPEARDLPVFKKWIDEGVAQGRSQGLSQGLSRGRILGERDLLRRLATKKFGAPEARHQTVLDAIDTVERLELLSERLLDSNSWDELLRPE